MQFGDFNRELLEHIQEHSIPLHFEEILQM